ncbi:MAG: lactate dehydrogenase [Faecalibacterium sp.]|jgi:D-lactate dehydrogenase|nr:lactate dehydrogenase [Faecalibacterium sp.]
MKIMAYEVRADERQTLAARAAARGAELTMTEAALDDTTAALAKGADGVTMLGQSRMDTGVIRKLAAAGVKVISTRTVGTDHIELAAAKGEGLHVFHARYAPDGVAEFTVMLMLMALRNYKQALYRANANDYSLAGLCGRELRSLTVGVVGTGAIGAKVIEILSGFGCRILAYNRHQALPPKLAALATVCPLETLYAESDVITLHLPLAEGTWHMIDRTTLPKMKDGVVLINCARGSLMCIEDVIHGIETQKIGALGLDVIEDEAGIYHQDRRSDILINRNMAYIRQFPNVILTQHMAFYTAEAVRSMALCGIDNIVDFLENGCTENEVN